ncbi:hypothetical protein L1267_15805 [Pseudoalteromonas sp. OFAV1]|uniref:hypothetical protein n=1 Tax=Pseudoalteromonas sp. OFAV1 TaxID=2908892 RepID=UPI001F25520B|nr:hypothetical protein [Pseudoalteromonas sp. OFAV1]MCF2901841.1 hypothetical protein [Pseudoalteromonas sp. OFAV1]
MSEEVEQDKAAQVAKEARENQRKQADKIIMTFLKEFVPDGQHVSMTGSAASSKLFEIAKEDFEILVTHDFIKRITDAKLETQGLSGDEIKALAIHTKVEGAEQFLTESVEKELGRLDPAKKAASSDNTMSDPSTKSPASDKGDLSNKLMDKESIEKIFDENPTHYQSVKNRFEKATGRNLTRDEVVKLTQQYQNRKNSPEHNKDPENDELVQNGNGVVKGPSLLSKGFSAAARALERHRFSSAIRKEEREFAKNVTKPAAEIARNEAKVVLEEMKHDHFVLNDNLNILISGKYEDGEKATPKERAEIQKETMEIIEKVNKNLQNGAEVAENESLPKKERIELHKQASKMSEELDRVKELPDRKASDKEFKGAALEAATKAQEAIKKFMESIKEFFKGLMSKGKEATSFEPS